MIGKSKTKNNVFKRLVIFAIAATMCMTGFAVLPTASAAGTDYYVRADGSDSNDGSADDAAHAWVTIGYAISQVSDGDTINVADGTYAITAAINVNKGVTITGDTANPENVIVQYSPADKTQNIFTITASNVKIEGIKTTSGKYAVAFITGNPTGCTISHCILDHPARRGIVFWTGSGTGHTVEYTTISNVGPSADANPGNECGIMIYKSGALTLTIQHNTFTNMYRGIWLFAGHTILIDDNTFTSIKDQGHPGNVFSGAPAIDLHNSGATGTGNRVEVTGNTVSDCYWQGILVVKCPYTYVYDNMVYNCNYYGIDGTGDWDYAAIHVQDYPNYGDTKSDHCIIDSNTVYDCINGIQIWSDDCQVTNNEIYNMGLTYADTKVVGTRTYKNSGILIGSNFGNPAIDHDPTGTLIQYNDIHDNYWGLFYSADLTNGVTAEYNYWGHASGPHHPTTNPAALGDDVSANVDYSPWLGFTVGTSPMTWHTNDNIQDAIDAATDGDTIIVHDGTYVEQLTVGKSITLQAGSTPIIDVSSYTIGNGITITADDVTIDGFEIIGIPMDESGTDEEVYYADAHANKWQTINVGGSDNAGGISNVVVKNCDFVMNSGKGHIAMYVHDDCLDITFTDNTVNEYLRGIYAHNDVDSLTVDNNDFNIVSFQRDNVQLWGITFDYTVGCGVTLNYGKNYVVTNNIFNGPGTFPVRGEDQSGICNVYAMTDFFGYFVPSPTADYVIDFNNNEITNFYLGMCTMAVGGYMSNNDIDSNLIGIQIGQQSATWATGAAEAVSITGNDITGNKRGIWVQSFVVDGIGAHCNNIVGNTEYGILNEDPESDTFDATCNWWGDHSGPTHSSNPTGTGDAVSDFVDYDPWIYVNADAGGPYSSGGAIHFDASGTQAGACGTLTYHWNFGDGTTGAGVNPMKTYTYPGTYTVKLTVTLTTVCGKTYSDTNTTTATRVGGDPPIIILIYPTGGEILSGIETVKWYAIDEDFPGEENDLPIYMFYSADDGETWRQIDDVLYNDGEYDLDTGDYSDGEYMIKVEAIHDGAAVDTSDPFTIDNDYAGVRITDVRITDTSINSYKWVKDGDELEVTAGITGSYSLEREDISADLSAFGSGEVVLPNSYDGFTATWIVTNAVCNPSNGEINVEVTVNAEQTHTKTGTITADNTAPEVELTKPTNGWYFLNTRFFPFGNTIIFGKITIEAEGFDTNSLEKIEFYIDGELKQTVTKEPFSWYMNQGLRGNHEITVKGYDPAGNVDTQTLQARFFSLFR